MSEIDNLKERARQIKNADTPKENTAYRVGSLFEDTIDYMGDIDVVNVDNHLSSTSTNPVQNKIITNALEEKIDGSELNNYYRKNEVDSRLSGKANTADLSYVATTGNYNDLSNKPTIPVVPSNVSAFNNDAGYLKQQDISGKADKSDLATVAMSGNYNDLVETPECITQQELKEYTYDKNTIDEKVAQGGQFDPTQYYTKNQTDSAINTAVNDMATMTWVGDQNYLTEHQSLDTLFDGAEYDINSKRINFKHGNTILAYIDATLFIKDGMVSDVEVKNVMIDGNLVLCLVITFNTESGQEPINIPIASIFDVDNFYTKDETDVLLQSKQNTLTPGTGITIENNTISITGGGVGNVSDVFYDNNNKKIYKTVDGNTDDVVTTAQLKSDMALDNVENKSSETIRGEITKNNVTTALGYTPPETDTTYEEATLSEAGLMSSSDKDKLDNIAANATKVETSEINGNIKIDGTETTVYTHQAPTSAEIVEALGFTPPQQDTNTTYQFQQDGNTLKMGTDGGTKNAIYTPSLSKGDVGLDNVDNTHDADKSVAHAESAGDAATVNGHTVASDVPSNAVFTDTTYSAGTGIDITNNVISATGGGGSAVTGVKGDAESSYRIENVNITEGNIANKTYNTAIFSGLGKKYLEKNMVDGKNILTQEMMPTDTGQNTIYMLRYDFDLNGQTVVVPDNCVLEFDGGSIKSSVQNGTLQGSNTVIIAGLVKIFDTSLTLSGSWHIEEAYPEWFGAKSDGLTECSSSIQKTVNSFKGHTIGFPGPEYCVNTGITVDISDGVSTSIHIYPTASIKATTVIDYIIRYYYTGDVPTVNYRTKWRVPNIYGGGSFVGNQLAGRGLWLQRYYGVTVRDIKFIDCTYAGLQMGSPDNNDTTYTNEGCIENIEISNVGNNQAFGILNYGADVKATDVLVFNCKFAVETHAWLMIKNLHACAAGVYDGSILMKVMGGTLHAYLIYNDNYQTAYYLDTSDSVVVTDGVDQFWMPASQRQNYNDSVTFKIVNNNCGFVANNYDFRNAYLYSKHHDLVIGVPAAWCRPLIGQLEKSTVSLAREGISGFSSLGRNHSYYKICSADKYINLGRIYLAEPNKHWNLDIAYRGTGATDNNFNVQLINEYVNNTNIQHIKYIELHSRNAALYKFFLSPEIENDTEVFTNGATMYNLYVYSNVAIDGYFTVKLSTSSGLFAKYIKQYETGLSDLPEIGDGESYKEFNVLPSPVESAFREQVSSENLLIGESVYDMDLDMPVYWNETKWIDSNGDDADQYETLNGTFSKDWLYNDVYVTEYTASDWNVGDVIKVSVKNINNDSGKQLFFVNKQRIPLNKEGIAIGTIPEGTTSVVLQLFDSRDYSYNKTGTIIIQRRKQEQRVVPEGVLKTPVQSIPVYITCNDLDKSNSWGIGTRNKSLSIYLDHFFNTDKELSLFFENKSSYYTVSQNIIGSTSPSWNYNQTKYEHEETHWAGKDCVKLKLRSILNSPTKNIFPKVLQIGDSVTEGWFANYPIVSGAPVQSFSWAKYFFEKDKSQNGSLFNSIFVGTNSKNTFNYDGVSGTSYAYGYGGKTAKWFCTDSQSAFYTSNGFSLASYLNKYKTLADDGTTRLTVGSTAGTEVTNVNAWDLCTPNIVVIQLGMNDVLSEWKEYMPQIVDSIKTEFPTMKIIISVLDACTCNYPSLYPDYSGIFFDNYNGNHTKLLEAYCYAIDNWQDESNGVYVIYSGMVMPMPFTCNVRETSYLFNDAAKRYIGVDSIERVPHPSRYAHAEIGYLLYSCIKWILLE